MSNNGQSQSNPPDYLLAEVAAPTPDQTSPQPNVDSDGLIRSQAQPLFKDDFVVAACDELDTVDYEKLLPPEGLSPVQRRAISAEPIPLTVEEEPERSLLQFTMTELFWLMTFLSVGFAVMYYLPPAQVAGVLGLVALAGQGLLMRFPPESRHVRLGAYMLLVMYVCAAAVAFGAHLLGYDQ
jgi:hypothetical protein